MRRLIILLVCLFAFSLADSAAPVLAKPGDKGEKAKRERADLKAHPYLYFTPKTLPDFKAKLKAEPFASRWTRLLRVADGFVAQPLSTERVVGGNRARPAQGLIEVCSLAYVVSGEKKYATRAKDEVWALLAMDAWHENRGWNQGAELPTSECSMACARFYDWCNDTLTDDERKHFRERALELGLKPYLASIEIHRPKRVDLWVDNPVTNWCGVCHGGCGLLGLALYDELPEGKKAADYAWKYLQPFLDSVILEDGGGHEGVMYWRYGVGYAFAFVTAWEHAMAEDLPFKTSDRLTGYWDVYMDGPDQRYANFNNMGEDTFKGLWSKDQRDWEGGPSSSLNALFEARTALRGPQGASGEGGDPLLLWAADNGGGGAFNGGVSPDWFLWRRDCAPAGDKPELQANVLFRGPGHAILSSEKLWLAFNGGWISDKSHNNSDLGSFVLVSEGERMLHDPGYGQKETNQHSTVTIGGESQPATSQASYLAFAEGKKFAWFMSDLSTCHAGNAKRCLRSVIVVEGKYLIVLDEIETTGTTDIDLRFQTKQTIQLNETGAALGGKFHIAVATPEVTVTTGDTYQQVKHVSIKAKQADKSVTFVSVLYPGDAPKVDWKVKAGKGTLTVGGDKHEFSQSSEGWVPSKISGEKVEKPEAPKDRVLKSFAK